MRVLVYSIIVVLTVLLAACETHKKQSDIPMVLTYKGKNLTCDALNSQSGWQVEQIQFFISDLSIKDHHNQWHQLEFESGQFQSENVALLSLMCEQGNVAEQNLQLALTSNIVPADISEIAFDLGVPFDLNHQNPLTQPSPLNEASMFWVWRTGHKFMRVEMNNSNDAWWFHLGSTGCSSASPVRSPVESCRQPNRFRYHIATNTHEPINIHFALDALLSNMPLNERNSCQSEPDNASCHALFSNVQRAFSIGTLAPATNTHASLADNES
ncbi:MbnP family copper-binding protein [Thalassotalea fusca]